MKKLLPLIIMLIAFAAVKAQGTLQFNQVKLVTTVETVPAGKVWKVESVLGDYLVSSCSTNPMHRILVNSNNVTVSRSSTVQFNGSCFGWQGIATVTSLPIWLPAGSTLAISNNVSSISVIEFNIVP